VVLAGAWISGDWIIGDGDIRRLAAEHVHGGTALGYALAGVLTAGFAPLAARTVTGLIHDTFLPRVPAADQVPG